MVSILIGHVYDRQKIPPLTSKVKVPVKQADSTFSRPPREWLSEATGAEAERRQELEGRAKGRAAREALYIHDTVQYGPFRTAAYLDTGRRSPRSR